METYPKPGTEGGAEDVRKGQRKRETGIDLYEQELAIKSFKGESGVMDKEAVKKRLQAERDRQAAQKPGNKPRKRVTGIDLFEQ